jgi:hypothetical protein
MSVVAPDRDEPVLDKFDFVAATSRIPDEAIDKAISRAGKTVE